MRLCGVPPHHDAFGGLVAAYSGSHRHYHNMEHITHCLAELDEAAYLAEYPDQVEYAIWLHDAVYQPKRSDNEEKSALWAREILLDSGCGDCVAPVRDLIMATGHREIPATRDAELITDIDLSILGQPPGIYDVYEAAIRAEYSQLPFADYAAGRSRILAGFLNRSHVYFTGPFEAKYGALAKENLTRALAALRSALELSP